MYPIKIAAYTKQFNFLKYMTQEPFDDEKGKPKNTYFFFEFVGKKIKDY